MSRGIAAISNSSSGVSQLPPRMGRPSMCVRRMRCAAVANANTEWCLRSLQVDPPHGCLASEIKLQSSCLVSKSWRSLPALLVVQAWGDIGLRSPDLKQMEHGFTWMRRAMSLFDKNAWQDSRLDGIALDSAFIGRNWSNSMARWGRSGNSALKF